MGQSISKIKKSCIKRKVIINHPVSIKMEKEEIPDVNYKKLKLDPLEMDCIVEMVFSYLDIESIKSARQVNKCWSIEGAKVLLSKCTILIPRRPLNMLFFDEEKALEEFKTFLSYKSKEMIMVSKVKIDQLDDIKKWNSIGGFGKLVNELEYNIIEEHSELLEEIIPNLPNLKTLKIPCMEDFVCDDHEIFLTKTRQIMNMLVSTVNKFDTKRHPLLMTSLILDPNSLEYLQEVERLADCKRLLVESFNIAISNELSDFPNIKTRAVNLLQKILMTNQKTMQRLVLFDAELLLASLKIPVMPVLTTFELNFYTPGNWQHVESIYNFPPSFQFRDTLPNLFEINLYWDAFESQHFHFWTDMFQNIKPAPSVQKMRYSDGFQHYCLDKVFMTFPNLLSFEALNVGNVESMVMSIWKYEKKLKNLELDINLEKIHQHVSSFDSIFTGFSPETVESIRNSSLKPKDIKDIEKLRVNASIWDLKDLEYLHIRIRGDSTDRVPPKMWSIAGKYAFKFVDVDVFLDIRASTPSPDCIKAALEKISKIPEVHIVS